MSGAAFVGDTSATFATANGSPAAIDGGHHVRIS
jgi:hypothetical protein